MTLISRSVTKPGLYSGIFPIEDNAAWEKTAATCASCPRCASASGAGESMTAQQSS